jgi:hypothetical protein
VRASPVSCFSMNMSSESTWVSEVKCPTSDQRAWNLINPPSNCVVSIKSELATVHTSVPRSLSSMQRHRSTASIFQALFVETLCALHARELLIVLQHQFQATSNHPVLPN